MGKISRDRGRRAELEVVHAHQRWGVYGERISATGMPDPGGADVVVGEGLPIQVKRVRRLPRYLASITRLQDVTWHGCRVLVESRWAELVRDAHCVEEDIWRHSEWSRHEITRAMPQWIARYVEDGVTVAVREDRGQWIYIVPPPAIAMLEDIQTQILACREEDAEW